MPNPEIEIEYLPLEQLVAADYNPRLMPEEDMSKLMASLERFGFVDPVVWNQRSGRIVGGHQRVEAARRLGIETVPVVAVSLAEEEERILNVGLNGISGEWDRDKLASLLRELKDADLPALDLDLNLTGFGAADIDALLASTGEPKTGLVGDDDYDAVTEEMQAAPVTRVGDVIKLGDHLLICGDATDPKVLKRLMQGETAHCVITDPPYNVAYQMEMTPEEAKVRKRRSDNKVVANDKMTPEAFRRFLDALFASAARVLVEGGPVYVYHADSERIAFQQAMEGAGIVHKQTRIWVKHYFALGRQDYHWQHEPCLYGWKEGAAHLWYGGRDKSTVIDEGELTRDVLEKYKKEDLLELALALLEGPSTIIREPKPSRSEEHPTSKPVRLYEDPMLNSSRRGDLVVDLCSGYGPLFIAAEKHGRRARGVELEPAYCDAIVARWEKWTGKVAER